MQGDSSIDEAYRRIREAQTGVEVRQPATPSPAVACVMWRPKGDEIEVYVVLRAPDLAFLGGYWAFPGGRVEDQDADHKAAVVREVAEETGVVLLAEHLRSLAGRWITPEFMPTRFDAGYYLAEVAGDVCPDFRRSDGELSDGEWATPAQILQAWTDGRWLVPDPVLRVLRELRSGVHAGISDAVEVQAAEAAREARYWELSSGIIVCPLRTPTLPPATHTNCYLIGSEELIVIDPASPYPDEQAELERVVNRLAEQGRKVVEIWLTHHHGDHVGGATRLQEVLAVPICAHKRTAELLKGKVRVDRELGDGYEVTLAGSPPRRLRALFTPGHAQGHLCFFEQETKTLIAGDMVAGLGTILIDPWEGNMNHYMQSLERMKEQSARVLLPAHGGAITAVSKGLQALIAHRLWRESLVYAALEASKSGEGLELSELVELVYSDVPRAVFPLAERSLLAHLHKLQEDGRVTRAGERWRRSP